MAVAFFTPSANEDALQIWEYISQFSDERADRWLDDLDEQCQLIADNPQMGRARPEIQSDARSFPLGNYTIYYRRTGANIEVFRVLHAARDIEKQFPPSASG